MNIHRTYRQTSPEYLVFGQKRQAILNKGFVLNCFPKIIRACIKHIIENLMFLEELNELFREKLVNISDYRVSSFM